ncbi:hypothetical protein Leucomu_05885 [Leucobacter muris]|uniref:DNA-binding protein n=1 Tax=Leucobacter muris TaxID=1935379 RepID=A0ABX5QEY7_9MICO|nr:hypothetical protein [Leucobacter muris]QAB17514.1 hypothetical protein Leucomu_05885 [Leucobacter muris]
MPTPLSTVAVALGVDDFASMPPIMTPEMLSDQLPDVEPRTLQDWRYRKIGPTYTRDEQTRRVYYLKSDVIAWLTKSRRPHSTNFEGNTP